MNQGLFPTLLHPLSPAHNLHKKAKSPFITAELAKASEEPKLAHLETPSPRSFNFPYHNFVLVKNFTILDTVSFFSISTPHSGNAVWTIWGIKEIKRSLVRRCSRSDYILILNDILGNYCVMMPSPQGGRSCIYSRKNITALPCSGKTFCRCSKLSPLCWFSLEVYVGSSTCWREWEGSVVSLLWVPGLRIPALTVNQGVRRQDGCVLKGIWRRN